MRRGLGQVGRNCCGIEGASTLGYYVRHGGWTLRRVGRYVERPDATWGRTLRDERTLRCGRIRLLVTDDRGNDELIRTFPGMARVS